MAESREEILKRNAYRFAEYYYDNVASKEGTPLVPMEKAAMRKGKDDYVDLMADAAYEKMKADPSYSPENWSDDVAARLDKQKPMEGSLYAFGSGKSSEQVHDETQFEAFRPLIEDGAWYKMSPKDLATWMNSEQLGYDGDSEKSRNQFWKDLQKYDMQYNRGRIVAEELASPYGKYAMIVNPTLGQEAVKQALTGNFDDSKAKAAAGIDVGASIALGSAAKFKSALAAAMLAGGVESGRQFANMATGNETNWGSPAMALLAAGTVPAGAKYLKGILSQAGADAKPFARGFTRGIQGFDDPLEAEKEALKNTLLKARESSVNAEKNAATFAYNNPAGGVFNLAEAEAGGNYQRGMDALKALGFESRKENELINKEVSQAVAKKARAENMYETAIQRHDQIIDGRGLVPERQRQYALEQAARDVEIAKTNLEQSTNEANAVLAKAAEYNEGAFSAYAEPRPFAENVLGPAPENVMTGPIQVRYTRPTSIEDAISKYYDTPAEFASLSRAGTPDANVFQTTAAARNALRTVFPEKYSKELAQQSGKKLYNLGLVLGRGSSDIAAPLETAFQVTPQEAGSGFSAKVNAFKDSDWYKNLDEQQKAAIEKAFKNYEARK